MKKLDCTEISNGKEKKAKRRRPDGTDTERYKNMDKWSYRKWAWQFLRRNPDFIQACRQVASGTADAKLAVAQQFGLRQFKSYTEPYKGNSGAPKFSSDAISSWTHLNPEEEGKCAVRVKLNEGQVLIRFDLIPAMADIGALDKQLRLARRRLNTRLREYAQQLGKKPSEHRHKATIFGIYLRLLDALAVNKTPIECARMIYPEKSKGKDPAEVRELVKKQIPKAREYAAQGYRYLSLLTGRPESKEIQLGDKST